ncbi:uncharacterized protein LOC124284988 [Haliotis rubra]|uniref:uncharacterized protein LOC124284988 n=1 Tax=Haliotis rubra TaxID=36100 RepID=UPI001EE61CB6|nr:uncharacterized protein LOC124284988 [Haliotis rubra]
MIRYASFALLVLTVWGDSTPFPQADYQKQIDEFYVQMDKILRQLMMQQTFVEERIRSDGQSGIKQIRQYHDGTRPYYSETHTYRGASAAHDHSNYDSTVGMGEVNMVMNGIDFRTRHNDYKLRRPATNGTTYLLSEDVPFPEVPKEVTSKKTLVEQVAEMREWYRAWKDQDHSVRDYRKYFKPLLCYMEGSWTLDTNHFREPFHSERHAIDATSWHDLQDKIRFTSYSGTKNVMENFAFLPTKILDVKDGKPEFAQWNYRILCHPLKNDLPLKNIHLQDDLSVRFAHGQSMEQFYLDRSARFAIYDDRNDTYTLMDELMSEIPGKDNYYAHLTEDVFGETLYDASKPGNVPLNTAYYHRWYKVGKPGSKQEVAHRGFSDRNLWVAQTSQPMIAPMTVKQCRQDPVNNKQACQSWTRRYSYALPLEIIWSTPMFSWNPFNLKFWPKGKQQKDPLRVGGFTKETAYNGTSGVNFYHTPSQMFTGTEVSSDPADTTKSNVGILDEQGNLHHTAASGTRIVLPNIPGIGRLRMRYHVVPVHGEGSGVWKELDALKDMMMDIEKYKGLFDNPRPQGHWYRCQTR